MRRLTALCLAFAPLAAPASEASAMAAFGAHCFSPFLTATRAAEVLPVRHDFYDLRPFSSANPVSEPQQRPATPGTDRRCEVAFDGDAVETAVQTVAAALEREGIRQIAELPEGFAIQPGAEFTAARQLNPRRIAVVQIGTRPGPNGLETFMNVERLAPLP